MQAQVLRSTLLRSGHEDACAAIERLLQIALTAAVLAVLITPTRRISLPTLSRSILISRACPHQILYGLVGLEWSPVSATYL